MSQSVSVSQSKTQPQVVGHRAEMRVTRDLKAFRATTKFQISETSFAPLGEDRPDLVLSAEEASECSLTETQRMLANMVGFGINPY